MALLKGITVILYERVQVGTDNFGAPVYEDAGVHISNVLVSPVSTDDIVSEIQISGKRAAYELCIPKGDSHTWENREVEFFGRKWRTVGLPKEYIDDLIPLQWNKKVQVERYA